MADLRTTYMGIPLRNPLIVGASTLTASLESIKRIEVAEAGALVTHSLFEGGDHKQKATQMLSDKMQSVLNEQLNGEFH